MIVNQPEAIQYNSFWKSFSQDKRMLVNAGEYLMGRARYGFYLTNYKVIKGTFDCCITFSADSQSKFSNLGVQGFSSYLSREDIM